ncbi:short chain oxidoreductase [Lineolata rhizophorae]|uniref:Short chain oxidoreductase n=1 Tax=Lineolata rhizophorae TaxID=578093 RepID=A0A6A6P410_9PEZI|nr:short chain oxidoreductase [Lineolata rhizophorae]
MPPLPHIVNITGAGTGFGALTARALARAGHTVYAGVRDAHGADAPHVASMQDFARTHNVDLRPLEQNVVDDTSVQDSISHVIRESGRLDVLVHNAGHMVYGPTEAFTPDQLATLYDINTLGTQRVNRAALPHMRRAGSGLVLWISSSSVHGGTTPFLAPYFAAKAGMDAMAVSYAAELSRWGVGTTIVSPGSFSSGTNHYSSAGSPKDKDVQKEYEEGPYKGVGEEIKARLGKLESKDADVKEVAEAIVNVVNSPPEKRPYRLFIDPMDDGSEIVSGVRDRMRRELYWRVGFDDLLSVKQH